MIGGWCRGESVFDFIKAIETHVALRGLGTPSGERIEWKLRDVTYEGQGNASFGVCAYS